MVPSAPACPTHASVDKLASVPTVVTKLLGQAVALSIVRPYVFLSMFNIPIDFTFVVLRLLNDAILRSLRDTLLFDLWNACLRICSNPIR